MSTRSRALAVLDSAGVGTDQDTTREHVQRASKFAGCFRGGDRIGAWGLVQLLSAATGSSPDGLRATATLAKISAYPVDGLAWAWADRGTSSGQLDPQQSGSPKRHPWQADDVTAIGAAMGWWREPESPRGILVLAGPTGCGKTIAAILASIQHGGLFVRAAQLGEMSLGQADALKSLAHEPLLVIDELGMENDIRPTPTRIVELLGTRHDQGLATLITTHLARSSDEKELSFSDRYGPHLLDRIERSGKWLSLTQATRRGRERPSLDRLRRSCRIADLLPKVEALTGTAGGSRALIDELQTLLWITDEMVDAGLEERAGWTAQLLEEADALTGPAGALVKAALRGGTESLHREASHG